MIKLLLYNGCNLIYLSSCIKYNAPKLFKVLRGKTSIWVSVLRERLFYSSLQRKSTQFFVKLYTLQCKTI